MISVGEDDDDDKREAVKTSAIAKPREYLAQQKQISLSRVSKRFKREKRDDLYKKRETGERKIWLLWSFESRLPEREKRRDDHFSFFPLLKSLFYYSYYLFLCAPPFKYSRALIMKRFFCSLSLSKCVSTKCEDSERREKEKKIWTVFLSSGPFFLFFI